MDLSRVILGLTQHWGNPQQILLSPPCPQSSLRGPPQGCCHQPLFHNPQQFPSRELVCRMRLEQGTNPQQGNLPSNPRYPWGLAPTRPQGVNPLGTGSGCCSCMAGALCPCSWGAVCKFLTQNPRWTPGFRCLTQGLRKNTLEAHLVTVWSDTICLLCRRERQQGSVLED